MSCLFVALFSDGFHFSFYVVLPLLFLALSSSKHSKELPKLKAFAWLVANKNVDTNMLWLRRPLKPYLKHNIIVRIVEKQVNIYASIIQ